MTLDGFFYLSRHTTLANNSAGKCRTVHDSAGRAYENAGKSMENHNNTGQPMTV
jgi:hypothetical protein